MMVEVPMAWLLLCGLIAALVLSVLLRLYRREHALVKALHGHSVDGMVIVNRSGIVLYVNRAAPELLHRSGRKLMGHLFMAPEACSATTEITVQNEKGESRILEIRKGPLPWFGQACHLLLLRDITKRKTLERDLRRQEERFQSMAANVPGVIYQWYERSNGECGYRYMSPRCEELLQQSTEQLKASWHVPRLPARGGAQWEEALRSAADASVDWSFERSLTGADGKIRWIRDLSRPGEITEDEVIFNGVLIDVTAQRKMNAALDEARIQAEASQQKSAHKNREITDSIHCAQRIQNGILADTRRIIRQFPDAMIYLRPRDIVSGDFYWFGQVSGRQVVVCADCTGHGVPGAFMTLLGNEVLHHVVNEEQSDDPGKILEQVDERLKRLLNVEGERGLQEGMEMAVCVLDAHAETLRYAGARLPLYRLDAGAVRLVKGTPRAIGERARRRTVPFDVQLFPAKRGDVFYLATDGFQDQFGGPERKKLMRSGFLSLLQKISGKSMDEQARLLNQSFEEWRGSQAQIDDVLVMGIRL
ncbi:MAG: SpoIIE family protein phosphatase [Kiritimatiellae bacterium]|nr:SpoIIE family protein phosphatase [Kiritimatiellia bacterium]